MSRHATNQSFRGAQRDVGSAFPHDVTETWRRRHRRRLVVLTSHARAGLPAACSRWPSSEAQSLDVMLVATTTRTAPSVGAPTGSRGCSAPRFWSPSWCAALHVSEGREFIDVAERAKPWWLVLAVCLQGATYLAQGEIFRRVPRAAGYHLPLTAAYELSLAKLFIDQALPSAGIGSTIVVAKALERRAVPRAVVAASMVINIASYHAAYVVCLGIALAITTAVVARHTCRCSWCRCSSSPSASR